jgi:hypothetical protein
VKLYVTFDIVGYSDETEAETEADADGSKSGESIDWIPKNHKSGFVGD